MIWLTWRQQRTEAIFAAGLVLIVAALLLTTGRHVGAVYDQLGLAHCAANPDSQSCAGLVDSFERRFASLASLVGWFNILPALLGILFAAPVVQEIEHSTYRLSWTQSVTRPRWTALKLGGAIAVTLVATFLLTMLTTWWRAPFDHLGTRLEPNNAFNFEGLVPYAYSLFALALVLTIGVLSRRLLAGVIGGFIGFLAVRLSIQFWLRSHLLKPVHFVATPTQQHPADLAHAWVFQSSFKQHTGGGTAHHFASGQGCFAQHSSDAVSHCMSKLGFANDIIYLPASRFWPLQGIESAIFFIAALALLATSAWWIQRRLN